MHRQTQEGGAASRLGRGRHVCGPPGVARRWTARRSAELNRAGKLWAPYQGWSQWAPCAANWPGHATERYTGPWNAKTKTPILLINNTYDPATGYPGAQHAERLLGNAVLLTVAGYGHPTGLPSRCADTWRVRYLVHLVTPPPGTVCGAQRPFP